MDFRFKFDRHKDDPDVKRREAREEKETTRRVRGLAVGMSIPVTMVAGPLAGWLLGGWLDRHFGTGFWMITLILLGTAAGLKMTIDMLSQLGKN